MADIADLAIRARTQGVQKAEREVKGLQTVSTGASKAVRALGGAIAALGVGGAVRAIRNNIRQTASISELGDVAGVSAERIQELSKAFSDMAGITESVTQGALRRFNRRLGLAEDGTGAAGDTFNQLGIAIKGVNGEMRATEPVLNEAIDSLLQIENESRRAARASELFGEDAGPQIAAALGQGDRALQQTIRSLREHGRVLSNETVAGAREANDELEKMSDRISTEFARRVGRNAEEIEGLANSLFTVGEAGLEAADGFGSFVTAVTESGLGQELERVTSAIPGALSAIFQTSGQSAALEESLSAIEGFFETADSEGLGTVRTLAQEMEALNQAMGDFADQSARANNEASEAALEFVSLSDSMDAINSAYESRSFEIAARDLEELRRQANPALDSLLETEETLRKLENALSQGLIDADEFRELSNALTIEKPDDSTQEAVEDWKSQFRDIQQTADASFSQIGITLAQSMEDASDSTKMAIASIGGAMGNLKQIMKEGGEDSFETYKRLAQAEAAIAGALAVQKALAWGSGGPAGIALAGTIGALTAVQVAAIEEQEYSGRKTGGQVRSGESYVVGEEGPEVVTMNGGGHVTPNHQLSQSGNSNNVTQVFQLSDNARREARQQIMESAPMIRNMAKQAVLEAAQNGGSMSKAVGRRS